MRRRWRARRAPTPSPPASSASRGTAGPRGEGPEDRSPLPSKRAPKARAKPTRRPRTPPPRKRPSPPSRRAGTSPRSQRTPPPTRRTTPTSLRERGDACRASRTAMRAARREKATVASPEKATPAERAATEAKAAKRIGKGADAEASAKRATEARRAQSRRTWIRARAARASESATAAKATGEAVRKGAAKALGRGSGLRRRPRGGSALGHPLLRPRGAGRLAARERHLRLLEERSCQGVPRRASSLHHGGDGGGGARVPGEVRASRRLHARPDNLRERRGRPPVAARRARQEPLRHQVGLLIPRLPGGRGQELLGHQRRVRRPGRRHHGGLHRVQGASGVHRVQKPRPPRQRPLCRETPSSNRRSRRRAPTRWRRA